VDDLDTVARVDVVLIRQDGFLGVRTHCNSLISTS
jgi:hypothetical protein